MAISWRKFAFRVIVDLLCLGAASLPILLFNQLVTPSRRGFFCSDESIQYPYHDSTVPSVAAGVISIALPMLTMILGQLYIKTHRQYQTSSGLACRNDRNSYFAITYKLIMPFLFGAASSQILTDIAKYSIGRLRPHFLDICQPDYSKINCSDGYVLDYECLGMDELKIKVARLSFPSGHASLTMYAMVYLVFYLQHLITCTRFRLLRPFCQFVLLVMAIFTCLSRIMDYKHHPTDVLAGALLGTLVSLMVLRFASPIPTESGYPTCKPQKSDVEAQSNSTGL